MWAKKKPQLGKITLSMQSALVLSDHDVIYVRAEAPIWSEADIDAYIDQLACISQAWNPNARLIFDYRQLHETPQLTPSSLAMVSDVLAALYAVGFRSYVRIAPEAFDPVLETIHTLSEEAGLRVRSYRTLDDAFAGPDLRDRIGARALIDSFFDETT